MHLILNATLPDITDEDITAIWELYKATRQDILEVVKEQIENTSDPVMKAALMAYGDYLRYTSTARGLGTFVASYRKYAETLTDIGKTIDMVDQLKNELSNIEDDLTKQVVQQIFSMLAPGRYMGFHVNIDLKKATEAPSEYKWLVAEMLQGISLHSQKYAAVFSPMAGCACSLAISQKQMNLYMPYRSEVSESVKKFKELQERLGEEGSPISVQGLTPREYTTHVVPSLIPVAISFVQAMSEEEHKWSGLFSGSLSENVSIFLNIFQEGVRRGLIQSRPLERYYKKEHAYELSQKAEMDSKSLDFPEDIKQRAMNVCQAGTHFDIKEMEQLAQDIKQHLLGDAPIMLEIADIPVPTPDKRTVIYGVTSSYGTKDGNMVPTNIRVYARDYYNNRMYAGHILHTVVHELMHCYDMLKLNLSTSYHTKGFFKRVNQVMESLLGPDYKKYTKKPKSWHDNMPKKYKKIVEFVTGTSFDKSNGDGRENDMDDGIASSGNSNRNRARRQRR